MLARKYAENVRLISPLSTCVENLDVGGGVGLLCAAAKLGLRFRNVDLPGQLSVPGAAQSCGTQLRSHAWPGNCASSAPRAGLPLCSRGECSGTVSAGQGQLPADAPAVARVSGRCICWTMVLGTCAASRTPSDAWGTILSRCASGCNDPTVKNWGLLLLNKPAERLQVQDVKDISKADRLIFPGVGAYGQAMERLNHLGYVEALKDYIQVAKAKLCYISCSNMSCDVQCQQHACVQSGKPFLGICLGLQLLFEGSSESGGVEGLNVVPGVVGEFDRSKGLPVPHIGWNSLEER